MTSCGPARQYFSPLHFGLVHVWLINAPTLARTWSWIVWHTVRSSRLYDQVTAPVVPFRPRTVWVSYVSTVPIQYGVPIAVRSALCHASLSVPEGVPSGTGGAAACARCSVVCATS